jgi:hypothetical protein
MLVKIWNPPILLLGMQDDTVAVELNNCVAILQKFGLPYDAASIPRYIRNRLKSIYSHENLHKRVGCGDVPLRS